MERMNFGSFDFAERSLSQLTRGVTGSEILKIGAEIRALKAAGHSICNLTVGDFDPAQFPIPDQLRDGVLQALAAGHTNYPPSDGMLELRQAVAEFYATHLGLPYPVESVLIASGARPLLYGTYRTLVDPGDLVVFPVPSWNNNHYTHLTSARSAILPVGAETNFFPRPEDFDPHLSEARLIVLNSPMNPTGTMISAEALRGISERIVEENRRREKAGQKGLWLCYDQVYWQLTFGDSHHVTPPSLVPEVAPYTLLLDAASKSYAATGLRVGWGVMPPAVRSRMADIIGHVGAWAPKAEQLATARLLRDKVAVEAYHKTMTAQVKMRLDLLAQGFRAMKSDGLPVDLTAPQGAIYLSARMTKPGFTNEDMRKHLLAKAGVAVVPFQAFGLTADSGWFRLSVGAVSMADIEAALPRLRAALA
jgi:aspartate aminotransferase